MINLSPLNSLEYDYKQNISTGKVICPLNVKIEKLRQLLLCPEENGDIGYLEDSISTEMHRLSENLLHQNRTISDQKLDRFGSKHKNLVYQANFVNSIGIPDLEVPMPCGLSTDTIEAFLKENAPEIFDHYWPALGKLYASHLLIPIDKCPFLEIPEAASHLKAIERDIMEAFSKASSEDKIYQSLCTPEIELWVEESKQKGHYLMVRSSGAEDTSNSANAGGNVSKAYVSPDKSSLCLAMGEVVSSYFSYSSLQNRINVEINPFIGELNIGLTTQELIGESIGGENNPANIPVSIVLFTNEPLYVGNEKFRVMRLSSTYGHGEGVVGGADAIPTDTYLIMQSESHPGKLYILNDIQPKTVRLGPVQTKFGIELKKIKNPPELIMQSSLDDKMLARIFHWGVIGEKCFGDQPGQGSPQDMEIVIKKNIIYPVQARPIIRPKQLPTYLDLSKVNHLSKLNESPLSKVSNAEMIVPGKASVVVIYDAEEILISVNLEQAERNYDKLKHKVVIVQTPEPANSHPVVNFSGMGVPCLYFPDKEALNQQLDLIDDENPCVICMQNCTISSWIGAKVKPESCISEGYAIHPAKISITLPRDNLSLNFAKKTNETPQEFKDLLMRLRSATTNSAALKILETLQTHSEILKFQKSAIELKSYIEHLKEIKKMPVTNEIKSYISAIESIQEQVGKAFNEMKSVLSRPDGERLRPLFYAKILETLLVKRPGDLSSSSCNILDSISLHDAVEDIINYQRRLSYPAHLSTLLNLGLDALSSETHGKKWKEFLLSLEPLTQSGQIQKETVEEFKQFVSSLVNAGVFSSWLQLFFNHDIKGVSPQYALEQKILKGSQVGIKALENLVELRETIAQMRLQVNLFGSSKTFDASWKNLQAISRNFLSSEFQSSFYSNSSELTKMALYRSMIEFVDVFDASIKAMKASQEFSDQDKLSKFGAMLTVYNDLMSCWISLAPDGCIPSKWEISLSSYLGNINESLIQLKKSQSTNSLKPSKDFSVSAASLGSETNYFRHLPETMEDIFTLIHQNLIFTVSNLNNQIITQEIVQESLLPPMIIDAMEQMENILENHPIHGVERPPSRVGITIELTGNVVVKYNVPLRQHSGSLEFRFDARTGQLSMNGSLFGEARTRWQHSKVLVEGLAAVGSLRQNKPLKISAQEIAFSWSLPDNKSVHLAIEEYAAMASYSMLTSSRAKASDLFDPFIIRCESRGVGDKILLHFLENPCRELSVHYDDYLKKTLNANLPQPIPYAAIFFSSRPCEPLNQLIAAWALTPHLTCKDFITEYRLNGQLKKSDEKLIQRFLPNDSETGHSLVYSRMKCIFSDSNNYPISVIRDGTLAGYIKNVKNFDPITSLIKENMEGWNNSAIIFEEIFDSCDSIGKLNSLYLSCKKAGIQTEMLIKLMVKLVNLGSHLDEFANVVKKNLKNETSVLYLPLMEALVNQGYILEESLAYCQTIKFKNSSLLKALSGQVLTEKDRADVETLERLNSEILIKEDITNNQLFTSQILSLEEKFGIANNELLSLLSLKISNKNKKEFLAGTTKPSLRDILNEFINLIDKSDDPNLPEELMHVLDRSLNTAMKKNVSKEFNPEIWDLFFLLAIQKNIGVELAAKYALQAIKNVSNPLIDKLHIVIELITNGFDETIGFESIKILHELGKNSLLPAINSYFDKEYHFPFYIVIALMDQGKGVNLCLNEVQAFFRDFKEGEGGGTFAQALDLLTLLLTHGKGNELSEVLSKALKLFFNKSDKHKNNFNHLVIAMINNEIPLSQELKIYVQTNFSLFANVSVEKGFMIDEAIDLAKKNKLSQKDEHFKLVVNLIKIGYAEDLGVEIARSFQDSFVTSKTKVMLDIYQALALRGLYQDEAIELANKILYNGSDENREKAYQLLSSIENTSNNSNQIDYDNIFG